MTETPGTNGQTIDSLRLNFSTTGTSFNVDNLVATPSSVPEPSSIVLLGTGLLGAIGAVRRKLLS